MTAAYGVLLGLHLVAAALLAARWAFRRTGRQIGPLEAPWLDLHVPELLAVLALCLGLFSYLYAANANMDYVQRFIASGGDVRLAPDTRGERLVVGPRYLPLLLADAAWFAVARLARPREAAGGPVTRSAVDRVGDWALPLSLLSALLYALALPSFAAAGGLAPLAWICLVPLFAVLEIVQYGRAVFYATSTGVLLTLLVNYWLATFQLLALQLATVVALLQYLPAMAVALWIARRTRPGARFVVLPAAWLVLDWIRSLGFLGYPWGMIGTSQYAAPLAIQVASIGGVWMVSFLVLLANGVAAAFLTAALQGARPAPRAGHRTAPRAATLVLFACFLAAFCIL